MRTALVLVFSLALATAAAAQSSVSGIVRDEANGAVSGASVSVLGSNGLEQQTVTGPDGRFTLADVPGGNLTMVVRAGGFAEWSGSVTPSNEVNVVLKIATLFETVTVTPTRTEKRLGEVPVSANIVEKETIPLGEPQSVELVPITGGPTTAQP